MPTSTKQQPTVKKAEVQEIVKTLDTVIESKKVAQTPDLSKMISSLLESSRLVDGVTFGKMKIASFEAEYLYEINGVKSRGDFQQLCKAVESYFLSLM